MAGGKINQTDRYPRESAKSAVKSGSEIEAGPAGQPEPVTSREFAARRLICARRISRMAS
jgi:hypothetical protein